MRIKPEHDAFAPIGRGVAQGGVRVANERAVLAIIAGTPGASNADIARISRLGPQTTSRILIDLEARDLILRGEVLRGRRGQPATPYTINPQGAFSIGVEIGWDHLALVMQNLSGTPIASVRRRHDGPVDEAVFDTIAAEVSTLVAGLPPQSRERLAGIGIASPYAFEALTGDAGIGARDNEGWARIDIAARVGAATGLPSIWSSDGNAITWSCLVTYPMPRPSAIAAFFLGTYLSGGIIGRSRLLDDARGQAAHPGAIIVAGPDGLPVPAQSLAAIRALDRRLEAAGLVAQAGPSRRWDGDEIAPHLAEWMDLAASALAQSIMSTCAIAGIEHAVIDGDLPPEILGQIVARTRSYLDRLPRLVPHVPHVAAGTLGATAAALGAAQMLVYRQFFSRAWELFDV